MIDENVKARFFDKFDKVDSGCWEWNATLRNGYGALKVEKKTCGAHRVSWMIHNGNIPSGVCICHRCDNPKCVNPAHLFMGTHSDNMKDAYEKGRIEMPEGSRFTPQHYPFNTKIPKEKAIRVKRAVENRGKKTLKIVSKEMDVPYQYVRDISCGRILEYY